MDKSKAYRLKQNEDWTLEVYDIVVKETGEHLPPDTFKGQALIDLLSEKRTLEDIKKDERHEDYVTMWIPSKGLVLYMGSVPSEEFKKAVHVSLEDK